MVSRSLALPGHRLSVALHAVPFDQNSQGRAEFRHPDFSLELNLHSAFLTIYSAFMGAGAFSPGTPALFVSNYRAALAFLDSLERQLAGAAAVAAFRVSEAHASFLRRWKLSIYYSTRFQARLEVFQSE